MTTTVVYGIVLVFTTVALWAFASFVYHTAKERFFHLLVEANSRHRHEEYEKLRAFGKRRGWL